MTTYAIIMYPENEDDTEVVIYGPFIDFDTAHRWRNDDGRDGWITRLWEPEGWQ